ncbi:MAG: hypothetical protein Q9218_000771 [Villophora microphyllina]
MDAASEPTSSGNQIPPSQSDLQNQVKPNSTINQPTSSTMAADDGFAKRPRDSRLIHMILASLGVSGYQERVPLQLMDFAYRYTSSTLQDALHLTSEGYGTQTSGTAKATNNNDLSTITISSLRLSIASRTSYQFSPTFDKDSYQKIAQERNQVQLPAVAKDWGVRLPPEQYCLTGIGWKLRDEFESAPRKDDGANNGVDQPMMDGADERDEDGAEDGNERMEDFFGEDADGNEEDHDMGGG